MKIAGINTVDYGSTGKIMLQISQKAMERGHEVYTYSSPRGKQSAKKENHSLFGSRLENICHRVLGPITGYEGVFSYFGTKSLIRRLKKIHPDLLQLHNLHGWYINLPMLFDYIKKHHIKTIWTLHDCWAFTGHCPHFVMARCEKWKSECFECPIYRNYPMSFFDNSRKMYRLKKKWFSEVEDLTIVTPSQWLADLVQESYLKDYPVKVIHNGIDLSVFKPTESDFRERHVISAGKKILLGVAFGWGERKGADVFIELAKRLDRDKYQIVLVGTDDVIDKQLPDHIISIHRTQNQKELAEIYTASDLFVNPTREENYPTVNMEALACGTPVLTFKTGGSPEIIDETCGATVDCDDIDAMEKEIIRICENTPYSREMCLERAKSFDMNARFEEYVKLYEKE